MKKRCVMKRKESKGFTLIELVIVMSVIAILLSVGIPAFQGMQSSADISKAEMDLQTLKTAVISFRRHQGAYPANLAALLTTTPKLINEALEDPFVTDAGPPVTYGYSTANDPTFGDYFIIYTQGVDLVDDTLWVAANDQVEIAAGKDDAAVSNAPVVNL